MRPEFVIAGLLAQFWIERFLKYPFVSSASLDYIDEGID
jgi:hypothetical protein